MLQDQIPTPTGLSRARPPQLPGRNTGEPKRSELGPLVCSTTSERDIHSDGEVDLTDARWRERLRPEPYDVLRRHRTERRSLVSMSTSRTTARTCAPACGPELQLRRRVEPTNNPPNGHSAHRSSTENSPTAPPALAARSADRAQSDAATCRSTSLAVSLPQRPDRPAPPRDPFPALT
jgi:hypothetical protein